MLTSLTGESFADKYARSLAAVEKVMRKAGMDYHALATRHSSLSEARPLAGAKMPVAVSQIV